ncbi:hypothetical protein PENTCL1PPCAC_10247, partial [Pristionchus entomophagus]
LEFKSKPNQRRWRLSSTIQNEDLLARSRSSPDDLSYSHSEFIPELEEIVAVGERTLILCRPQVAA